MDKSKITTFYLDNKIGDQGAIALSKNVSWTNLISLDLSYNKIGDQGGIALSENISWTNLTSGSGYLSLGRNYIGDDGRLALTKRWPNTIFRR